MIYDLDYNEIDQPKYGETYRVPCVHGLPVVLPSHVDHGDDGPTGKHWHSDTRFDHYLPWDTYDDRSVAHMVKTFGNQDFPKTETIGMAIVRDEGEPIEYVDKVCAHIVLNPTGAVFQSLIKLYLTLGDQPARNMKCVHHATVLQKDKNGCLTCPAHGLKYTEAGSPRYVGPFYLKIENVEGETLGTAPAATGDVSFKIRSEGRVHQVLLFDSLEEEISRYFLFDLLLKVFEHETCTLHLGASWPTDTFCPSFRKNLCQT